VSEQGSISRSRPAGSGGASFHLRLRAWRRYWIRDPLFGALDFAIHYGCRWLPIDWCSAIGGFLGTLNGRYRYKSERERARGSYLALSGANAGDADSAVMRLFANVGRTMLEFSLLDRLWAAGRIMVVGAEHLQSARAAGKPVIMMGVHLGNWEVIGPTIVALGFRGSKGFYQPPRNRFEHRIAVAARKRYGAIMLRQGIAGARGARRHLVDERGILLVYVDEERSGCVQAPTFGRPIPERANLLNVVRLAWASEAVVIPVYVERLEGCRFRITCLPVVELAPEGENPPAALVDNVGRLDRIIAQLILARLDQWYMLLEHRRGDIAIAWAERGHHGSPSHLSCSEKS
jgi:Kdo2-lipid IVA lauroyltransferase/acyltransferase